MNTELEEKYTKAHSERQRHISAILSSSSKNKIVVAGPGTGKTYLFKEILNGKNDTLTLTFVNALVEDLSLELCGISDVRTLHSYARSELSKVLNDEVKLYPKLPQIIQEDAKILLSEDVNFDQIFQHRDDGNKHIEFYKNRKDYYNKHYGYSDVIFAIVKHFESKKDKIPTYQQVVVDEFQDFNKLEVSLVDLLAEKSPMLLAGDDDQALYGFKGASADHIRHKHSTACPEYAPFNLPFCSRCTRVIVEAANDVINAATKAGLLKDRINKPYTYFDDRKKDLECASNPKIVYNQSYAGQIPWFIQERIGEIAKEVKGKFSVLIISPTKKQSQIVVASLRKKGFQSIEVDKKKDEKNILMDGLNLLLEDKKSNLGWRIVSKCLLKKNDFEDLLKKTQLEKPKPVSELIDKNCKKDVEAMVKILRAVRDDKVINEKELNDFLKKVGFDPHEIAKDFLKDEIDSGPMKGSNPGIRKIRIKATTVQSSKGLAEDYVFITHFDDQYFIKDKDKTKVSDQDVCSFLVAITRARKKVFLISSDTKKQPIFLKWISKDKIEKV